MSVTVRAPAKINLHLGVGARRVDGYHPLATVYQAIGLYDDVTVTEAAEWDVTTTGGRLVALAAVPDGGENIAIRAGLALTRHHGISAAARIEIHKSIPVAGGLAGGSADAAATLLALDLLWELRTPEAELLALAAGLGSDVPFALVGGTAAGAGHGELVDPVEDAGEWWWVVVGNEVGLSTPAVYAAFDDRHGAGVAEPRIPGELTTALAAGDPALLAAAVGNDLQEPALGMRPDLRRTLADGQAAGALACLLSGSGPTVVMLARDAGHAREVAAGVGERGHDRVIVAPGRVAGAHPVTYA